MREREKEGEKGERERKEERELQRQMGDEQGPAPCCLAQVFLLPSSGCMISPIAASPFCSLLRLRFARQGYNSLMVMGQRRRRRGRQSSEEDGPALLPMPTDHFRWAPSVLHAS